MVSNSNLPNSYGEYNKIEPWFKTSYFDQEIPSEWIKKWKNIQILDELKLPEPNIYLTTDFSLVENNQVVPDYPERIYKTPMMELWYRLDNKFKLPLAYINFYFITPSSLESPSR